MSEYDPGAERSRTEREAIALELSSVARELGFSAPETFGDAVLNRDAAVPIEAAMGQWREQAEAIADRYAASASYYEVQAGLTVAQAEVLLRAGQTEAAIEALHDAAEYTSQIGQGDAATRLQMLASRLRQIEE